MDLNGIGCEDVNWLRVGSSGCVDVVKNLWFNKSRSF
jgi:hypothetical protein